MTCKTTFSSYHSDAVFNDFLINVVSPFLSHTWCTVHYLAVDSPLCGFICETLSTSLSPHTRVLSSPQPQDTGNTLRTSESTQILPKQPSTKRTNFHLYNISRKHSLFMYELT